MKKIFLLLTVFSMVFTSCDPLEDITENIEANQASIVGDVAFEMSDDDYDALELSYGSFDSEDDAKALIPELLSGKYPVWGKQSSAAVTYKLYNKKNDEKSLIVYTAQDSDYTDSGLSYTTISSDSQMSQLLDYLYPTPEDRVLVSLTYAKYDSGIVSTVKDGFIYSNGAWEKSTGITEDEYASMGESRAQFSNEDEALVKIPVFLKNKLAYEAPEYNDIYGVMYNLYVTDTEDIDGDEDVSERTEYSYVVFYIYDGVNWVEYNNTINQTIQFGHDGETWVPDNTIKYTLVRNADYAYMASQLTGDEYATLIGNLADYGDFDYNWTDNQIVEALTIFMDYLDPSAEDGQKYVLTYVVYDNGEGNYEKNFIREGGVWVINTDLE
ncbi:hypothetical protein [Algibacter sp. L4_22]|uniref:hypothetical protein n=1 Tax=Algibacter sp. L4_22 TaxID=2942477 RepID=UPI00201B900E|nr:hypothetical protein [Algibacter sp. L4_22]MCL5127012.1 hypothetical protein [Algibacter sp. L4_22]